MQKIISIKDGIVRMPEWRMAHPVNFESLNGEHIAIVGPNGGGKSMFVDIIIGKHPLLMQDPLYDFTPSEKHFVSDNIKYISFRDSYGEKNDGNYFLQQRWNQMEISHETPTVGEILHECNKNTITLLGLDSLLDKQIILLSSGELRKLQIAKTLMLEPRVLIIDNPFIGLDEPSREQFNQVLTEIANKNYIQLILVMPNPESLPVFITHVIEVKDMTVGEKQTRSVYESKKSPIPQKIISKDIEKRLFGLNQHSNHLNVDEVIKMIDVSIKYGNRTILNNLNWVVKNGECWSLSGQNGAGKSTLLSLVCADNPQGYSCHIELFGKLRGTGESIWDIKKHIGYVSPEMHRSYNRNIPSINIVASGLKDTVGLYVKPSKEEYDTCKWWMEVFGLKDKENISFLKLSSGEQRLVLLARAFVKDPDLLILDEPLHGLDDRNKQLVKNIIDIFSKRDNKTIIMVSHYKEELPECINHSLLLKKNN